MAAKEHTDYQPGKTIKSCASTNYSSATGYRLLGEFSGIWEAKNFAAESGMSGIFSLVGENYRDSWYEPKKQDKNGNKD